MRAIIKEDSSRTPYDIQQRTHKNNGWVINGVSYEDRELRVLDCRHTETFQQITKWVISTLCSECYTLLNKKDRFKHANSLYETTYTIRFQNDVKEHLFITCVPINQLTETKAEMKKLGYERTFQTATSEVHSKKETLKKLGLSDMQARYVPASYRVIDFRSLEQA